MAQRGRHTLVGLMDLPSFPLRRFQLLLLLLLMLLLLPPSRV
jgi:hypothetical protein